ncbi:hypothetical protein [Roseobacter sp. OBYS 0001]|uniref:hypothetical protein n=1 Tax=Roseobacter sp. OBYS 0001 TaxID=882651 RepID=UPI001BC2F74B|nr:hypothetical protein [Roseobacter sp. OBYS 0001]GIT89474.1 hypothetical protein ROBYS_44900 [Roseobacter sp. OBYS 0001]
MPDSPSTWKYVGVWWLAGCLGNITSQFVAALIYSDVGSLEDVIEAMIIVIPLEAVSIGAIMIAVYSFFSSLNMSAVYPWMVSLVVLGLIINLVAVAAEGVVPSWVYFYQIACTATMLYGIRYYFKSKGRIV